MAQLVLTTTESSSRTQTQTFPVTGLKSLNFATVSTGTVEVVSVVGDKVSIKAMNGSATRSVQTGGTYTAAHSRTEVDARTQMETRTVSGSVESTHSLPSSIAYNSGGYSGTLSRIAVDYTGWNPGSAGWETRTAIASYSGTVTRPASDTRTYTNYYQYNVTFNFETNSTPTLTLSTTNARTLYENDTFDVTGTSKDADIGNVVSVKYSINGGTVHAISTAISTGADIPFNKTLTFKNKRLFDGATSITADLLEGAQHTLRVWAEDDQGGKSADVTRTFQVVANRAPILTIAPVADKADLIDSDSITLNGTVSDPDGNSVVVEYKVGSGSFAQVYSGNGGSFTINMLLSALKSGANPVAVRATDSYGAVTTRNLSVAKTGSSVPLKKSVQRYKITPPNATAQGIILWIERDTGDLVVSAEISMTGATDDEAFVPMTLNSTAFVGATRDEDEFQYEGAGPKEKIILKLTMVRADAASPQAIRLVSGVLS